MSGRTSIGGPSRPGSGTGTQQAIAHAQQERLARQRERDRLMAARKIQTVWRGHRVRRQTKSYWRRQWDELVRQHAGSPSQQEHRGKQTQKTVHAYSQSRFEDMYDAREDTQDVEMTDLANGEQDDARQDIWSRPGVEGWCLQELRLLLLFVDVKLKEDRRRLNNWMTRFMRASHEQDWVLAEDPWRVLLVRLTNCLLGLLSASGLHSDDVRPALTSLTFVTTLISKDIGPLTDTYYRVLSKITQRTETPSTLDPADAALLIQCVVAPLRTSASSSTSGTPYPSPVYERFIWNYLTIPDLPTRLGNLTPLITSVDYRQLINTMASSMERQPPMPQALSIPASRLMWLLSYLIFARHHALESTASETRPRHLLVTSQLLATLRDDIIEHLGNERPPVKLERASMTEDGMDWVMRNSGPPVNHPFIREQLLSLLSQRALTSYAFPARILDGEELARDGGQAAVRAHEAMVYAGYVVNLMAAFPSYADDVRMWVYLGSTTRDGQDRIPALRYFWNVVCGTVIFQRISQDPQQAVELARPPSLDSRGQNPSRDDGRGAVGSIRDQSWKMILLFLELYSFVLKVVDDDEFFAGGSNTASSSSLPSSSSPPSVSTQSPSSMTWAEESALPLSEVQRLTTFLKNLAFALFWYEADIKGTSGDGAVHNRTRYRILTPDRDPRSGPFSARASKRSDDRVAGPGWMSIAYLKDTVTGLLRMLYERDSRRPFLPKDHWLMTSMVDMDAFIPAVVEEEEKRRQAGGVDSDDEDDDSNPRAVPSMGQSSRPDGVTPRLEILENTPFFIPFATRVKIFRRFIHQDQCRRRGGSPEPDAWRMTVVMRDQASGQDTLARHHATIRRDQAFQDAFAQFDPLREELKEPIQITFVDRFGQPEAGIDGGGVTKEFLLTVTQEAFARSQEPRMFVETEQHQLHPNPSFRDELRDAMRRAGLDRDSPAARDQLQLARRQYQFLGRVVGKCLYEGILVDLNFAGFFLLKWASAGGARAGGKGPGYRPSLNDVRELDEALYQGLLKVKHYQGNMEDLGLTFTIDDPVVKSERQPDGSWRRKTKAVTKELQPGGASKPVTRENRLLYLACVAHHKLQTQQHDQTEAFLRGLGQIIDPAWLSMFNRAELQTLVSGAATPVDVEDLRRNTQYEGVYQIGDDGLEHPTVQMFWAALHHFSDEDRRRVLKFVTSTPRAPLLGFSQLRPSFAIRDSSGDQERLPSASTCVNLLKLPRYQTAETLRSKLLYAVRSGAGFDLS
ncbi:MAG: Protein phosphatase PP2A regulatory subunit B [Watsoniomyces obsoletus]|nr:MAG: Protein phosphatase PP2A regulatory subunit B [Watsoniomyces obsoletus]